MNRIGAIHISAVAAILITLVCLAEDPPATQPLLPTPSPQRMPGTETNVRRIYPDLGGDKPAKPPTPPPFIIGAWLQPMSSMAVWKARGINTMVGYEGQSNTVSREDWVASAASLDLFSIREPDNDPADDLKDPYLLAWMHHDEPDIRNTEPAQLGGAYARWKKEGPKIPVFLNISGEHLFFKKTPRAVYNQYFEAADWIGNDFYPVGGFNQPTWLARVGQVVDLCRDWSGGKPQFAFIESSFPHSENMPADARGVTPDEMRVEIWDAVIHGVKGIVYFPQQFNPFKFDATPTNVAAEMAKQNELLTQLAAVLATPANPKEIKVSVNPPLEVAWRKTEDGSVYVIALNLANAARSRETLTFTGVTAGRAEMLNGDKNSLTIYADRLTDDFSPYQARIYKLGKGSQPLK